MPCILGSYRGDGKRIWQRKWKLLWYITVYCIMVYYSNFGFAALGLEGLCKGNVVLRTANSGNQGEPVLGIHRKL